MSHERHGTLGHRRELCSATLVAGIVLVALAGAARLEGHGESIRLSVQSVAIGDSLAVTGQGFGPGGEVSIALVGMELDAVLKEVLADGGGRFVIFVRIPVTAPSGLYRIVATAGEDRAEADLLVTEPADRTTAEILAAGAPDTARAGAMPLDRHRSRTGSAAAWGIVALLAGAGFWLARFREPRRE